MNKKLFLLLSGCAFALFFACSGEVVENTEVNERAALALKVTVQDYDDGALVDADVSLNDGEAKQSTGGIAIFKDVTTGTHTLRVKAPDYAEWVQTTTVNPVAGQNAQFPRDYAASIRLYKKTAGLWGYIRYTDENGNNRPAPKGIKVALSFNSANLVDKYFEATTDDKGKYEFKSLPATSGYTIWIKESEIGKIKYNARSIPTATLYAGGTVYAGATTLNSDYQTNLFVVSDYPSTIEYSDLEKPIVFKFTEAVDKSKLKDNSIRVSGATADLNWKSDTELEFIPMGNWKTLNGIEFDADEVKSVSGKPLPESYYGITVRSKDLSTEAVELDLLTDAGKIDHNSPIYLTFSKIEGATNYVFYANDNEEGVYRRIPGGNANLFSETTTDGVVELSNLKITKEIGILVQATNADSRTPLVEDDAITIKDNVNPTISGATDGKRRAIWNSSTSKYDIALYDETPITSKFGKTDQTYENCVSFSEPIRVTDVKFALKKENGINSIYNRVSVERNWNTTTDQACYILRVKGDENDLSADHADNKYFDAILTISGLKDVQGNKFKITYVDGNLDEVETTDVVEIRFKTSGAE